jgi:anaerobic ribonucleoside-triphosphate reductase activating protein
VSAAGLLLRLHAFLPVSRANGPGRRAVLWVQGCSLGCPGCFNPGTHPFDQGEPAGVDEVFSQVMAARARFGIQGVTVSGGEPLQQRHALLALLGRIRAETDLSALVFTGYTWQEVGAMRDSAALLGHIDVLIAGRYDQRQHLAAGLRGSASKTIHLLSNRYCLADIETVPATEVIIDEQGEVVLTGIDPWNG